MNISIRLFLCIVACIHWTKASNIGATRQDITLSREGGYGNVIIAIEESVPEDLRLLDRLQEYFAAASTFMLKATKGQVYFSNLTILVPNTWSLNRTWETAGRESFDSARVLIAGANQAWGHIPYTLQPGQCGQEADYIHFTPEYLTNDTARGLSKPEKRIVREFAHLKWGLFDEDVQVTDKVSPTYYFKDQNHIPTRCSYEGYYGQDINITTGTECDEVDEFNYRECEFSPVWVDTSTSIMYKEHLGKVIKFCTESNHNKDAPNRQNRLCRSKSAWEVMAESPDFAMDHKIVRNEVTPPDPTFKIVQVEGAVEKITSRATTGTTLGDESSTVEVETTSSAQTTTLTAPVESVTKCQSDIVCLALDVSTSMNLKDRRVKMRKAMEIYITQRLQNETAVGIVSFQTFATILTNITAIYNQTARQQLADLLPVKARGGTSIRDGLEKCTGMLTEYALESGVDVGKTRIFLVSDGKDSTASAMIPSLKELGITVDTLLYGQTVDDVVLRIADETGGMRYLSGDSDSEAELNQALIDTTQSRCNEKRIYSLTNEKVDVLSAKKSFGGSVPIDSTIGVNTTLLLSYSGTDDFDVDVTSSKGNNVTVVKIPESKLVTVVVDGVASKSDITYNITKRNVHDVLSVLVSVTSKSVPGVAPILYKTRVDKPEIDFLPNTSLKIYTDIFQGLTPVLNLTVHTMVKTGSGIEKRLLSVDDGTGDDSTPNDGVYTSSLHSHQFNGSGFYSIQIKTDGEGLIPTNDVVSETRRVKRCLDCDDSSLGRIVRTKSAGVVKVVNHVPVPDTTPPERIKDLTLSSESGGESQTRVFNLTWTAPGNDLNIGRAAAYNIYVSNDSSLDHLQPIEKDYESILTDLSDLLVDAGTKLNLAIDFDKLEFGDSANKSLSTYYIRMTAEDDLGNVADYSNPVALTLVVPKKSSWLLPPTTSTQATTSTSESTVSLTSTSTSSSTTRSSSTAPVDKLPLEKDLLLSRKLTIILGVTGSVILLLFVTMAFIVFIKYSPRNQKKSYNMVPAEEISGVVSSV